MAVWYIVSNVLVHFQETVFKGHADSLVRVIYVLWVFLVIFFDLLRFVFDGVVFFNLSGESDLDEARDLSAILPVAVTDAEEMERR